MNTRSRLDGIVTRRVETTLRARMAAFPVVIMTGARAVGKSVLLHRFAEEHDVTVVDLDDLDTRDLAEADPSAFTSGPTPVCVDEFQHVPRILDAIKAELNRRGEPGRFVLTGSTRYEALPRAAQALTGRLSVLPVWPLAQGEIDGVDGLPVARLLRGELTADPTTGTTTYAEYAARVLAGGFPQALALPVELRPQWFRDYVSLVCERDVIALSKIRQRAQLPRLLTRLAAQTAQVLNIADAARAVRLEPTTAENYTQLLEAVFLIHRLPAWGTTLASKISAMPKIHLVDTGVGGHLSRITEEKLARRMPQTMTEFGHLLETFVVNEVLSQVTTLTTPVTAGHYHDRSGDEVDLVLERTDGSVLGIEVKASAQAQPRDSRGMAGLARRLGEAWLGGVVFYTGRHTAVLDADRNIVAMPIDTLWTSSSGHLPR